MAFEPILASNWLFTAFTGATWGTASDEPPHSSAGDEHSHDNQQGNKRGPQQRVNVVDRCHGQPRANVAGRRERGPRAESLTWNEVQTQRQRTYQAQVNCQTSKRLTVAELVKVHDPLETVVEGTQQAHELDAVLHSFVGSIMSGGSLARARVGVRALQLVHDLRTRLFDGQHDPGYPKPGTAHGLRGLIRVNVHHLGV